MTRGIIEFEVSRGQIQSVYNFSVHKGLTQHTGSSKIWPNYMKPGLKKSFLWLNPQRKTLEITVALCGATDCVVSKHYITTLKYTVFPRL